MTDPIRSTPLGELISYLDRKAYTLECCDTTNDYREAQKYRRWIEELKGEMSLRRASEMVQAKQFDEIEALRSNIASEKKEWKPISEQPEVGQDTLAWCGWCITATFRHPRARKPTLCDWHTEDGVNPIFNVTHWMPLPKGPQSDFDRAMELYPDRPEHHEAASAERKVKRP